MVAYLNYISYLLITIYIIYVVMVYISLKFNYLFNLRARVVNHFMNKYKIISNDKAYLSCILEKHYLIMFILTLLFLISFLLSSRISFLIILFVSIKCYLFRKDLITLR